MIAENIAEIRRRIALACERANRHPADVTLIAVAKTFGSEQVREVIETGVPDIGENYVQEMVRKRNELTDQKIRWHCIGHLQSNKVKQIIEWIHCIHSVDSLSIGREIARLAERSGRVMEVLVEVNTSGETSKYGLSPQDTPSIVRQLSEMQSLNVKGLMTIGPFLPDPEQSRPSFRMLREIRDTLLDEGLNLPHLSMGMTNDFEVAIDEGATMVRVGTAIFGKRVKANV